MKKRILITVCAISAIAAVAIALLFTTPTKSGSYTVVYRHGATDIAEPKKVSDVQAGTSVTENAIDVDGYVIANQETSQTITIKSGDSNIILFNYDEEAGSHRSSAPINFANSTQSETATIGISSNASNSSSERTPFWGAYDTF